MIGLWKPAEHDGIHISSLIRFDLSCFLLFLAASDNKIVENEVLLYQMLTEYDSDADRMIADIKRGGLNTEDFKNRIPYSVELFCEMNEFAKRKGINTVQSGLNVAEQYVMLFEYAGKLMIGVDNNVTKEEDRDYEDYIDMLKEYIETY